MCRSPQKIQLLLPRRPRPGRPHGSTAWGGGALTTSASTAADAGRGAQYQAAQQPMDARVQQPMRMWNSSPGPTEEQ
ncbi:hypothetical protein E2562_005592 [Oryza meyeriana var. granulata]|uniref:Uncharacterized protein n=1 Tax=Oryza meyeriana var. granulata TaxID=110450 RepID=A0A6G1F429_9ORYZ|nr:hypothetical protein E2562_005592 [Oryza meyeriana var. granulata]